ncbi:hypothetical protein FGG08_001637 [Glutinoglossum americanum]|uniref:Uncharacterized protein n=1 Tax=Glutinoglossum americanum TaxID=1670608 RepID=A0A9P8I7Y6_9PEZI|nr:hypothetical protein FGG08_001637 [Glutinoglossum americanum]
MASRRITPDEKDMLGQDDQIASSSLPSDKSNITPAVPALQRSGNSTFAGATAAIMANFVLIAYVVVAMKEDQSERLEAEKHAKEKKGL